MDDETRDNLKFLLEQTKETVTQIYELQKAVLELQKKISQLESNNLIFGKV